MHKISTEIKWALIFSVATLAWMLAEKVSGLHDRYIDYQMYLTLLFLIPAVWIYLLALKNKRKKDYGGRFTYFQGFVSGFFFDHFHNPPQPAHTMGNQFCNHSRLFQYSNSTLGRTWVLSFRGRSKSIFQF